MALSEPAPSEPSLTTKSNHESQTVTVVDYRPTRVLDAFDDRTPPDPRKIKLYVLLVAFAGLLLLGVFIGKPGEASTNLNRNDYVNKNMQALIQPDLDAPLVDWTSIVLHHSASIRGGAKSFDEFHRAVRGWRCLGYDFVIGNGSDTPDGLIEVGPRWKKQEPGAHANSVEYNTHGIGICLVGNFETDPPTPEQYESLKNLMVTLMKKYHIPKTKIFGHGQIRQGGSTTCPGKFFPMQQLIQDLP